MYTIKSILSKNVWYLTNNGRTTPNVKEAALFLTIEEAIDSLNIHCAPDTFEVVGIDLDTFETHSLEDEYEGPECTLQAGDIVRLNSGGPCMTVNALFEDDDELIECRWFDDSDMLMVEYFHYLALRAEDQRG